MILKCKDKKGHERVLIAEGKVVNRHLGVLGGGRYGEGLLKRHLREEVGRGWATESPPMRGKTIFINKMQKFLPTQQC